MFFMIDNIDIANYADDNTSYGVGKCQCDLETKLQKESFKLFKWFHKNDLKANQDKCHFLLSLDINTKFSLPACILENSEHVINLCDKASTKFKYSQEFSHIYPKRKGDF